MTIATPSRRDAFLPSLVIDGAMKPMMMSGTQKVMSWPMIYCKVTMTFMTLSGKIWPRITPMMMPRAVKNDRILLAPMARRAILNKLE